MTKTKINRYNRASDKFSEAESFLRKMKESIEDIVQFRANLSAFLSASRTVMLVWKDDYEADKNSRFGKWFGSLFIKFPILKYLQETRNSNSHEGILQIEAYGIYSYQIFEIVNGKEIFRSSIETSIMTSEDIDKFIKNNHPGKSINKVQKPKWKFPDFPKEYFYNDDVIEVSSEIIDKLGVLLIQMKSEFPELCE